MTHGEIMCYPIKRRIKMGFLYGCCSPQQIWTGFWILPINKLILEVPKDTLEQFVWRPSNGWLSQPNELRWFVVRKKRWKAVMKITMKGFMHFLWEEQEALRCDLLDLRLKQRSVWVQSFAKVAKVHQDVTSLVETEAVRWQWQYPAATRKQ